MRVVSTPTQIHFMMVSPTVITPAVNSTGDVQATCSPPKPPQRSPWEWVKTAPHIAWLLTKDDFFTFVCPNTIFGIFSALSGSPLVDIPATPLDVLLRLHWVILFNWSNLLIFDLANQRLPSSAQEDMLNKPWRPVPSGLMTSRHVRRALLATIPAVFAFNHYVLHVGSECAWILVLTWLYNDLGGGDEDWILRNSIIAAAFWPYNAGSVKVAARDLASNAATLTSVGTAWTTIVSLVILTTMHVQDLKDQAGDRKKGRRTAPLVLGDDVSRWTIAVPVTFWSLVCTYYWQLGIPGLGFIGLGFSVSWRCVMLKGKASDRRTWELWALWTAVLYSAPFVYTLKSRELTG